MTVAGGVPSRPQILFSRDNAIALGGVIANYDVSRDGQRFYTFTGRRWLEHELAVVVNWLASWSSTGADNARRTH